MGKVQQRPLPVFRRSTTKKRRPESCGRRSRTSTRASRASSRNFSPEGLITAGSSWAPVVSKSTTPQFTAVPWRNSREGCSNVLTASTISAPEWSTIGTGKHIIDHNVLEDGPHLQMIYYPKMLRTSTGSKKVQKELLAERATYLLEKSSDVTMIGQCGARFYPAYLFSERALIITKLDDDELYVWESQAGGPVTLFDTSAEPLVTEMTLCLKDDELEYLEEGHLKDLINKHSEFISYPISLWMETIPEWLSFVNGIVDSEDLPLNISREMLLFFFEIAENKNIHNKFCEALSKNLKLGIHEDTQNRNNIAELLKLRIVDRMEKGQSKIYYIAGNSRKAVENSAFLEKLKKKGNEGQRTLYLQDKLEYLEERHLKDLIKKHSEFISYLSSLGMEMIPEWLSFVKGIVDSEDLPLNISRGMLQQNKILIVIRRSLAKKSILFFFEIAENKDGHNKFYEAFSKNLKLGIHEDTQNRNNIAQLLKPRIMDRMESDIYYITGKSRRAVENSAFLVKLKKKGYERQLKEFEGKKLASGRFRPINKAFSINLRAEMVNRLVVFKEFHQSGTKHRRFTWICSLGISNINAKFDAKPIELIVTTCEAALLLLFNGSDNSEIVAQLNLSEDVVRLLHFSSTSCEICRAAQHTFKHDFKATEKMIEGLIRREWDYMERDMYSTNLDRYYLA